MLKLFAQPMDRAEALHAPRNNINDRRKNNPGENELVLSGENSNFPKISITYVQVYLPLNMPAVTKNITLQEAKPSLRVIFNYGLSTAPGKFVRRNLEQIQVEWCQLSVCVQLQLAAGGEPSTRFPPGGLVEPAGIPDASELPRLI